MKIFKLIIMLLILIAASVEQCQSSTALREVSGSLQINFDGGIFSGNRLEIIPIDSAGKKIFSDSAFNDKPLRLKINGEVSDAKITDGAIILNVASDEVHLQKIFFEDLGIKFNGEDSAQIKLAGGNFLAWTVAAIATLVMLYMCYLLYTKRR